MIEDFLTWWVQHLLAWLPAGMRGAHRAPDALVADVVASGLALSARRGDREASLGRIDAQQTSPAMPIMHAGRRGAVVLRLPPGAMLRREVELPLAAERELAQVLRYEMDRLTPFTPEELYWTWQVHGRDRARGRLHVRLLLVPRNTVEAAVGLLRRAGAVPTTLEAADGPFAIPLAPADPRRDRRRRRTIVGGAAACAGLAVAAVAIPFLRQSLVSRQVEARIAALRPEMDRVDALRRRIAAGTAGADVLAAQRAATGDPLTVLALVTGLLPDDTYLSELTLRGRVLTLSGQSAAAARLIPALSSTPVLRDPGFAAPVTRNETTRTEQFSIRASVAP